MQRSRQSLSRRVPPFASSDAELPYANQEDLLREEVESAGSKSSLTASSGVVRRASDVTLRTSAARAETPRCLAGPAHSIAQWRGIELLREALHPRGSKVVDWLSCVPQFTGHVADDVT